MNDKMLGSWTCNGIAVVFTAMQTEQVLRVISLVMTIIATLISIGLSIYALVKKAKADGKITSDEMTEIADKAKEGIDQIKEACEKAQKEKEKDGTNEENR